MSSTSSQPLAHISSRYDGLDTLKCLCAFFVVLLHYPYGNALDAYLVPISRMAVPIFLMISGFFFERQWPHVRLGRQLSKTLQMFAAGVLLYLLLLMQFCRAIDTTLPAYFALMADGKGFGFMLRNVLLYNASPLPNAEHLWYLQSLLYTLLIVFAIRSLLGKTGTMLLYLGIPFLLLMSVVFSNYSTIITGYRFYVFETRNFLLCGIPYFCLGSFIFAHKDQLLPRFSSKALLFLLMCFCAASCLEEHWLCAARTVNALDFYFSTAFQSFFAFLLFLKLSASRSPLLRPFAYVGRNHAGIIYLIHLAVGNLIPNLFSLLGLYPLYRIICPLIVYLASLGVSVLFSAMLHRIRAARSM